MLMFREERHKMAVIACNHFRLKICEKRTATKKQINMTIDLIFSLEPLESGSPLKAI